MMRLFIAAPISSEIEKELSRIISALKTAGAPVKWVAPSNIHLTLKFLGDTDEKLIPPIKKIIDHIGASNKTVPTTLNALGAFPSLNRPRVYWIDLKGADAKLGELASALDNTVHELGFEKESHPFRSHLTLGRVKFPENLEKLNEAVKNFKVTTLHHIFNRIILFKSTLTPRGSIYDILYEARLR